MNVERAIELGEDHARDFAAFNIPFCGNECDGEVVTPENCRRIHFDQCMEASENSKQFTPFEFIASEFNKEENSEELWEAFENAVSETIQHDINQTEWEDYGVDVYSFQYCAKQVSITEHSECFPETDEEDESDIEFYDSDIHRWFGK